MGDHHTEDLRSHEGAPELRVSEQKKVTKPKKGKVEILLLSRGRGFEKQLGVVWTKVRSARCSGDSKREIGPSHCNRVHTIRSPL